MKDEAEHRPAPAKGPVQGLPSDQPPGEGMVQVNDANLGGGPPDPDPNVSEQHPTGG